METMLTIPGCFIPNTSTYQDEPSKGCVSSHSLNLVLVELEPFQTHTWRVNPSLGGTIRSHLKEWLRKTTKSFSSVP